MRHNIFFESHRTDREKLNFLYATIPSAKKKARGDIIKQQLKKSFLKILLAAILSMVVYIVLYAIWGAILNAIENSIVSLILLSTFSTVVYVLLLFYFVKKRNEVGADEILADYKEIEYLSWKEDFKIVLKREKPILLLVGAVLLACLILNKFDALVFQRKTISLVTFPFMIMCICFPESIDFLGYFVSYAVIVVLYLLFVLTDRKRQYRRWFEKKEIP